LEAGEAIPAETVAALDDDALVALVQERIQACFDSALDVRLGGRHAAIASAETESSSD